MFPSLIFKQCYFPHPYCNPPTHFLSTGHTEVRMGGLDRGEAMVSHLVKMKTDEKISGWGEVSHFKKIYFSLQ